MNPGKRSKYNWLSPTNLKYMRLFYLAFPIRHALSDESAATKKRGALLSGFPIRHSARDESPAPAQSLPAMLRLDLSWTHYRLLLGVEAPQAREWYMHEAADQHWSTRQLERQIFAARYMKVLPTEEQLAREIEREQRLIEARRVGNEAR